MYASNERDERTLLDVLDEKDDEIVFLGAELAEARAMAGQAMTVLRGICEVYPALADAHHDLLAAARTELPPPGEDRATLLAAIDAEANLAGLMCEADDADIAAQHIERIRALVRGAVAATESEKGSET